MNDNKLLHALVEVGLLDHDGNLAHPEGPDFWITKQGVEVHRWLTNLIERGECHVQVWLK